MLGPIIGSSYANEAVCCSRTATVVSSVPGNPANVTQAFGWNNGDQQGAVSAVTTHWLSSSEPPGGHGDLYVAAEGTASQTVTWVDDPEDLQLDVPRNKLWSLSEGHAERYVFAVSPLP